MLAATVHPFTSSTLVGLAPEEIIVDNFAGGGGASTGIEQALGRPIDIAINHDPEAIAMHAVNHPNTRHLCESVWKIDIKAEVADRPVGLVWFSPDCKHFSKAKGGKPVSKKIRGLAWVALKWAGLVKPRVIILENVEEFRDWSRLQNGKPNPRFKGETFKRWVRQLRKLSYVVEWRELRACDYGAPTIRKRLFVVARRDRQPIVWPDETHAPEGDLFCQPFRTAADCIDWTLPCPSIFLTPDEARILHVRRPLAPATLRRIARGVQRYVINAAEPFIVPIAHYNGSTPIHPINEPLRTVTASPKGGTFALVTPFLAGLGGRIGQSPERPVDAPYHTITAKADTAIVTAFISHFNENGLGQQVTEPIDTVMAGAARFAMVTAFLAQYNTHSIARDAGDPISTVTGNGAHQSLIATSLVKLRGTCRDGQPIDEPLATVSAQGTHIAEVRAFLMKYYGTDQAPNLTEPMHTVTTKDRLAVALVKGHPYLIADIGMRMLTPRELFRAQGFPDTYIIDHGLDPGTHQTLPLSKKAQVRMCGNSVVPHAAEVLVRAQFHLDARAVAA
jgi:DNA (cytosine-5)-methyltransferase 1